MTTKPILFAALAGSIFLAGCSSEKKEAAKEAAPAPTETPQKAEPTPAPAAGTYKVRFETTRGNFVVEVHPEWAPLGADRFKKLVEDKYFDDAGFFRVVPNFIVQFGLAAKPAETKKWDHAIKDDPVKRANVRGTLVFATAGPNTRTAQLFINLGLNQNLDSQGFAPFATVVEGMSVVDGIYPGYGENPDQDQITRRGNAYLKAQFPKLDYVKKAVIL